MLTDKQLVSVRKILDSEEGEFYFSMDIFVRGEYCYTILEGVCLKYDDGSYRFLDDKFTFFMTEDMLKSAIIGRLPDSGPNELTVFDRDSFAKIFVWQRVKGSWE